MDQNDLIISCGALEKPLQQALNSMGKKNQVRYLDALLHLKPQLLGQKIREEVDEAESRGKKAKLLFGKCADDMDGLCKSLQVPYTQCENCYHMFLGKRYQQLLSEEIGTYFLEPYLCNHFERLVIKGLKLDQHPKLKQMMFQHYRRAVYIDYEGTGLTPAAHRAARYLELPLHLETADSQALLRVLVKMRLSSH